ncbi:MAG: CvpA family protein [Flavobacteriales bacterium]|jgi:membrane protein required for colicin V production|nr:CvpA family protein [Flavobacteriales bacterium]MBK6550330.1 CvpA family protein [Flavobacteriales bacterium]MBK6881505.1 CvpA family protein [Flavobacteriales bacterium]MBK7102822.1 CvpA family protein [Flavobacteriales bacterium]MBK7113572.1 CvpA family protein [Flavobacteriales bacterium]
MNWLDWVLVVFFVFAAYKGFTRGFIIEFASLVALVAGLWAGVHFSDRMIKALGLQVDSAAIAFLITFLIVLLGVHLLARALTKLIDIAQLSLPNKLAGVAFGVLRSAFGWSVLLNLVGSYAADTLASATEGSRLYPPVVAMAPLVIPAVKESKWVQRTVDDIRDEVDRMIE